jgi:hypothetical protein
VTSITKNGEPWNIGQFAGICPELLASLVASPTAGTTSRAVGVPTATSASVTVKDGPAHTVTRREKRCNATTSRK